MTSAILIRPALAHEVPEIEDLSVAAYTQYRDAVPAPIFDAYLADLRNLARYWNEASVLVAERDGEIAGSVLFYADAASEGLGLPGGWAGFRKLAVRPGRRGQGIGRKLVVSCLDIARRLGAPAVGIHTSSFMSAACRLYDRVGFQRCAQYDLKATDIMGVESGAGEVMIIAFRMDLAPR